MAKRKIVLRGQGFRSQYEAAGTILPGHLVALASTGKVAVHAIANGNHIPMFAVEEDFLGEDISDSYAAGAQVQVETLYTGCRVYALLPANAQAVVKGDFLESNGDGCLRLHHPQYVSSDGTLTPATIIRTARIVAMALEAVDNSAVGAVARISVEIV